MHTHLNAYSLVAIGDFRGCGIFQVLGRAGRYGFVGGSLKISVLAEFCTSQQLVKSNQPSPVASVLAAPAALMSHA